MGAFLIADISHVTGLIVAGEHVSPVPYADVVMTTTHKTFRGPRGAMIMVTPRGMEKDPKMGKKIDAAIIPGLQGGPHNATTAGIAIAAAEAMRPEFTAYAKQIKLNAMALANRLMKNGLQLVGGGTETHLMVIDLTNKGIGLGTQVSFAMDVAGIYANRNTVPGEQGSPFFPSGIRIGTPLVTTRGMKQAEMVKIKHGTCYVANANKNNNITIPSLWGGNSDNSIFSELLLAKVINARVEKDILGAVKAELIRSGYDSKIKSVILTGGGALLRDIRSLSEF